MITKSTLSTKQKIISFLVVIILLFSLFSSSALVFANFSDVNETTKYYQAIEFLKNNDVVGGYPDGTFKPEQTLNRAELLKILIEATVEDKIDESKYKNCFPDVKEEWFAKYVCYGKEKGVIDGYPDGTFKPANAVNFIESLKMTLGVLDIEYIEGNPWYKDIVEKGGEKRLIPFDITTFGQVLNRGQMADMMTRGMKDKDSNDELDWYLQNAGDCQVTYHAINQKQDVEKSCFTTLKLHALGYKKYDILVGKNTTALNLSYRDLESVEGLENLKSLTKLDLGANELQDISFLKDLTNLKELDLRDNWLWDISPVANLTNLEKLNLNLNIMGDPAPLGSLTKLKWLGLYKNQYLYDISALDNLNNLEYIDLGLAELNDGELDRFTTNHPKTKIDNELKPWVGKKTFDLIHEHSILRMKINFFDMQYRTDIDNFWLNISKDIRNDLKNYSYINIDDINHISSSSLLRIKDDLEIDYTEEYIWDSHLHPEYLVKKLKEYKKIESVEYKTYLGQMGDLRYDEYENEYEKDLVIIGFKKDRIDTKNLDKLLTKYFHEIALDKKRKGEEISKGLLSNDFNGFTSL